MTQRTRRRRQPPASRAGPTGPGELRYVPPAPPAPHVLVAVDLGGRRCGVSMWWVDAHRAPQGALLAAGHWPGRELLARHVWPVVINALGRPVSLAWVVEVPHQRGDDHSKRRGIEALLKTKAVIRAQTKLPGRRPYAWRPVRPHIWKGNVPKHIHHTRALRALTPAELALVGAVLDPEAVTYEHNTADAIALGLWALGRIGRGGVLP